MKFFDRSLIFFGKLKEHFSVVYLRLKMFLPLDFLLETAAILEQLLRGFLIVPEIGRRGLCLDRVQFIATCRDIKETSRAGLLAREGCQMKSSIPGSIKFRSS